MADQQVDKFITELSQILERNRQQRAATESELAKSDAQQVAAGKDSSGNGLNASSGFAQGFKGAMGQKKPGDKAGQQAINAKDYANPETSYGGDAAASPYGQGASPTPSARALSPSTTSAGRVGLAQNYAHTQELLANNPYKDDSAGFERDFRDQQLMGTNPYAQAPTDGIAEEQAKRTAQRAALANGQPGPLGGAGQQPYNYGDKASGYGGDAGMNPYGIQPAAAASLSPSVTAAGRAGGQQAPMAPIPYPETQQPDMALLEAYQQYQRQRGGL